MQGCTKEQEQTADIEYVRFDNDKIGSCPFVQFPMKLLIAIDQRIILLLVILFSTGKHAYMVVVKRCSLVYDC